MCVAGAPGVGGNRRGQREELEKFTAAYKLADQSIGNRAEQVANVCATIEVNMRLLGCSAVEDKLQARDGARARKCHRASAQRALTDGVGVWVWCGRARRPRELPTGRVC